MEGVLAVEAFLECYLFRWLNIFHWSPWGLEAAQVAAGEWRRPSAAAATSAGSLGAALVGLVAAGLARVVARLGLEVARLGLEVVGAARPFLAVVPCLDSGSCVFSGLVAVIVVHGVFHGLGSAQGVGRDAHVIGFGVAGGEVPHHFLHGFGESAGLIRVLPVAARHEPSVWIPAHEAPPVAALPVALVFFLPAGDWLPARSALA